MDPKGPTVRDTEAITITNAAAFCSAIAKSKRRSVVSRKRNRPVPRFPIRGLLLPLQVAAAVSTASAPCVPRVYLQLALLLRETAWPGLLLPVSNNLSMISSLSGLGTNLALDQSLLAAERFQAFLCTLDELVYLRFDLICEVCFVSTHGAFVYEEEDLDAVSR